jgi:hypothetical protein
VVSYSPEQERPAAQQREDRIKAALLLENLLIEPDNYGVLYALCQVYTIHDFSQEDAERDFLSGVNEILLQNNSLLPFIQYVVRREVDACNEVNTLFRQRTVFTLLLADMLKRQPCVKFLSDCTSGLFSAVLKLKTGFSIETRDDVSHEQAAANARKLLKIVDTLMSTTRRLQNKCPPSLRKICELLSSITASKYPDLRWSILGSVLFLRFFNPAICSPEKYGFVTKDVSPTQRKLLISVSKIIQNATNGSLFLEDAGPMLAAHEVFNQWLRSQEESMSMKELFAMLVSISDDDWQQQDLSAPSNPNNVTNNNTNSSNNNNNNAIIVLNNNNHNNNNNNNNTTNTTTSNSPPSTPSLNITPLSVAAGSLAVVTGSKDMGPSPRRGSKFGELISAFSARHTPRENMGLKLTAEESLALRLHVLDTLTLHQKAVEAIISLDTRIMTQWLWLKESLKTQLHNSIL